MRTINLGLAGVVLAATSSAAQNNQALGTAGILGSIAVSPTKSVVQLPVTITVAGVSKCGSIKVYFGDDGSVTLTDVSFPRSVQHSYSRTGTYTIRAEAVSNCKALSSVQTTLLVEGSAVTALCSLAGCDTRDLCTGPTIKKVIHVAPLEPTDEIIVTGCGFGAAPRSTSGGVHLKGAFPMPGTALPLEILSWSATAVFARVPAIKGVRDQPAKLQLTSGSGANNEVAVTFRATRAITYVYGTDTGLSIQCSTTGYYNVCERHFSWRGLHFNNSNQTLTGFARINLKLLNGYVFDSWFRPPPGISHWWWAFDESGLVLLGLDRAYTVTSDVSGLPVGSSAGEVRLAWTLAPYTYVEHNGVMQIKGPVGVPYK